LGYGNERTGAGSPRESSDTEVGEEPRMGDPKPQRRGKKWQKKGGCEREPEPHPGGAREASTNAGEDTTQSYEGLIAREVIRGGNNEKEIAARKKYPPGEGLAGAESK